jgi:hypothetical protein
MTTVPSPPYERIFNDTKIIVPGLTDAVFKQVIFAVTNDFCDATNVWTQEFDISADPQHTSYTIVPASGSMANRLMMLYDPAVASPDKRWVMGGAMMQKPDVITVPYAPSSAVLWKAIVALLNDDPLNSEGYPDVPSDQFWWLNQYRDAFVSGCLARLFLMPAKTYSNPKLAAYYQQLFTSERSKARGDVIKANTFGGQRWQFPQGWSTVTRKGWT